MPAPAGTGTLALLAAWRQIHRTENPREQNNFTDLTDRKWLLSAILSRARTRRWGCLPKFRACS